MRVRETARRELDHALRALDDNERAGEHASNTVRIMLALYRQCPFAFVAFESALRATVSLRLAKMFSSPMTQHRVDAVKRLAPVMLEVLLDSMGIETDG